MPLSPFSETVDEAAVDVGRQAGEAAAGRRVVLKRGTLKEIYN